MRWWLGPSSLLARGHDNNRTEHERGAALASKEIKPSYPKQDVESKNEVFDAAADFLAFVVIPRHVWASSARCLGVREKKHGLLHRLCVRGGTGSALRGCISLCPHSNVHTAASGPRRGMLRESSRRVHGHAAPKVLTDVNAAHGGIKIILCFMSKLRLQEAGPRLRVVVDNWLGKRLERLRLQPIMSEIRWSTSCVLNDVHH